VSEAAQENPKLPGAHPATVSSGPQVDAVKEPLKQQ
jgi:hypothetical protein